MAFWIDPLSGFLFLRNISSCCCPAHNPRTHSLFSFITLKKITNKWYFGKCILICNIWWELNHLYLTINKSYLNEMCRLFSIIILYSSAPSSTTWRNARRDGAPDKTAVLHAGSPMRWRIKLKLILWVSYNFIWPLTKC